MVLSRRMQTQTPSPLCRSHKAGALQSPGTACSRQASKTHNPIAGDQRSLAELRLCAVTNPRLFKYTYVHHFFSLYTAHCR